MTNYIDHNYFHELADAAPDQICRKGRCRFDPADNSYALNIWGEEYVIDCTSRTVVRVGSAHPLPHDYFYLFVIYYLLTNQEITVTGEWISEKDLPGGTTFFRGPHLISTKLISDRFASDIEGFKKCCRDLGGVPLKLADAAFRFTITPDIPVAVLFWQGDEDFPAEAGILYDRSMKTFLPLDILFALAVSICFRIGNAGRV